ncbi:hypothetical protein A0H81_02340 [Grifola frondosa]|uniref:Uncharacterized protein n=1 Tax=Grifola frondosa TaxID=5627 RepID=A0A1C7MMJ6_GRIFR|nr:hypothetical protein A0H81_02340 [Grifola frondosa]
MVLLKSKSRLFFGSSGGAGSSTFSNLLRTPLIPKLRTRGLDYRGLRTTLHTSSSHVLLGSTSSSFQPPCILVPYTDPAPDLDLSSYVNRPGAVRNRALSSGVTQALYTALPVPDGYMHLLPLSFAQRRTDIRDRKEGFEMASESSPFAVRTQTLIPLQDAFARDDIRRRGEGFEIADGRRYGVGAGVLCEPMNSGTNIGIHDGSSLPSGANISAVSTISSFYSLGSWVEFGFDYPEDVDFDFSHTTMFTHDELTGVSVADDISSCYHHPQELVTSTSSFDEESFLRMAASLGW